MFKRILILIFIQVNSCLRIINLSDCSIGKEGVAFLVASIKMNIDNTQLKSINLQHNEIPSDLIFKVERLVELIWKKRSLAQKRREDSSTSLLSKTENDY